MLGESGKLSVLSCDEHGSSSCGRLEPIHERLSYSSLVDPRAPVLLVHERLSYSSTLYRNMTASTAA